MPAVLPGSRISARERWDQILSVLEADRDAGGDGVSSLAIASRLGLGMETVSTYLGRMQRAGLVELAGVRRWVPGRGASGRLTRPPASLPG